MFETISTMLCGSEVLFENPFGYLLASICDIDHKVPSTRKTLWVDGSTSITDIYMGAKNLCLSLCLM